MKKFLLTFLFLLSVCVGHGQVTIQMEKEGNIFRIPCLVNGAKMKLVFDTGASVVSLSLPMAEYLYDNGYITKNDFKGVGQTTIADGQIVDHLKLNLKDIEIGGLHLSNVEAIVMASQNAPLLLGQSAIQKLGRIQLNENLLIILDGKSNIANYRTLTADDDIEYLFNEAWNCYQNGLYTKAIEIYGLLNANNLLADYGKELLAICYLGTHDYVNCLKTLETMDEWKFEWYALAYEGLSDRENALYYWTKQLDQSITNNDYAGAGSAAHSIGSIYYDFGEKYHRSDNNKAIEYLQKCLSFYEQAYNLPQGSIWNQSVGNQSNVEVERLRREVQTIDYCNYMLAQALYNEAQWTYDEWKRTLVAMAKNKNKLARDVCDKNYWSY